MIHVPARFEERIRSDPTLTAAVAGSLALFEPWLEHSGTPLFPYYTDHGPRHIEEVLETAASIVTEDAWDILSPADCAALVLAALLHDAAMHLSEDAFLELVQGPRAEDVVVPTLDRHPWNKAWGDFMYSALRWDHSRAMEVLGDGPDDESLVEPPPDDVLEWNLRHRQLAGEFVRQHHARLAHEIALEGVPAPEGLDRLRLSEHLEPDLADIVGVIARSHGMAIRDTLDHLDRREGRRSYREVHAVFLMVVLRVADYLQVHAARAPGQLLRVKRIRNPKSRREWAAHRAVKHIHVEGNDPEAVIVHAEPHHVATFLQLQQWTSSFQAELDSSWAILGEVYGSSPHLKQLGITLRRIQSNVAERHTPDSDWPFYPHHVAFDVARPELLKLMIKPLYGDRPEVGIRELVQNGLDAVRELQAGEAKPPHASLRDQEADIVVEVVPPRGESPGWVHVADRGVGMTPQVVADFFLKAGASYRGSDAWRQEFEQRDDATAPRSRVLRSGRFGVGALAAFLLGDSLVVETRHRTSAAGVRFTTTLDAGPIELVWDQSLKTGTRVSVPISAETWQKLSAREVVKIRPGRWGDGPQSWDWYCWTQPTVLRKVDGEQQGQSRTVPHRDEDLPDNWVRLPQAEGFGSVYWSRSRDAPALTVNGLLVEEAASSRVLGDFDRLDVLRPKLSVADPDGRLPLSLQRDRLAGPLPFNQSLMNHIIDCALAYAENLARPLSPVERALLPAPGIEVGGPLHPGPWLVLQGSMAIFTRATLRAAEVSRLILIAGGNYPDRRSGKVDPQFARWEVTPRADAAVVAVAANDMRSHQTRHLLEFLFPNVPRGLRTARRGWLLPHLIDRPIVGRRLVMPAPVADSRLALRMPAYAREIAREDVGSWAVLTVGACGSTSVDLDWLESEPADGPAARWLVEWDLAPAVQTLDSRDWDELRKVWIERVDDWKVTL